MGGLGLYLAFLIPPLVLGFAIQAWLKKTVSSQLQVPLANGMTGEQIARTILDSNGLHAVPVQLSPGGALSDHYDPRARTVNLSPDVGNRVTVASAAIAAHEVGHAIQHEKAYAPFRARSALFPAVSFASSTWIFLLFGGALLGILGLVKVAIVLFAVVVLFQLVTLPVEFDASRRAKQQLHQLGLVTSGEAKGVSGVLTAAAMTYVAAALAAVTQLAYYALVFLGNRN